METIGVTIVFVLFTLPFLWLLFSFTIGTCFTNPKIYNAYTTIYNAVKNNEEKPSPILDIEADDTIMRFNLNGNVLDIKHDSIHFSNFDLTGLIHKAQTQSREVFVHCTFMNNFTLTGFKGDIRNNILDKRIREILLERYQGHKQEIINTHDRDKQ